MSLPIYLPKLRINNEKRKKEYIGILYIYKYQKEKITIILLFYISIIDSK